MDYPASLSVDVDNIHGSGFYGAKQYLDAAQTQTESLGEHQLSGSSWSVEVSGRRFEVCRFLSKKDNSIVQDFLCTIIHNFSFNMVLSYKGEQQKAQVYALLSKMKFKKS